MLRRREGLGEEQRELVGKKLHWQLFKMPYDREGIDHLHCAFCAAQMVDASGAGGRSGETDGYTTDDRHLRVCNRCFDRLNPEFPLAGKMKAKRRTSRYSQRVHAPVADLKHSAKT